MLPSIPLDTPTWWYVTAMSLAVVIIGIAKSGFGGGIGILAVPLVANALPADRTLGFMLPVLMVADVFAAVQHRRNISRPHLKWVVTGAAVGIAAATLLLVLMQKRMNELDQPLRLLVGSVCLIFVGMQVFRMVGGRIPSLIHGRWGGRGTGFVAGGVSTLAHAAGPVVSVYLLEERLSKARFAATMVFVFFIVNWLKVPGYFAVNLITLDTLTESLVFLPLVPVGAALGIWMHNRVAEKPFTLIIYLATVAAAINMLREAIVAG
ncbi:MAG: sulfite exporter TauE/SafE family protein [Phycisphaeraceae bacterium]